MIRILEVVFVKFRRRRGWDRRMHGVHAAAPAAVAAHRPDQLLSGETRSSNAERASDTPERERERELVIFHRTLFSHTIIRGNELRYYITTTATVKKIRYILLGI